MEGGERRTGKVPTLENSLHYTRIQTISGLRLLGCGSEIRRSFEVVPLQKEGPRAGQDGRLLGRDRPNSKALETKGNDPLQCLPGHKYKPG